MSYVRQHHEYAKTGKPSQECSEKVGPEPPKTNFDGIGPKRGSNDSPHRVEKGKRGE